MNPVNNGTSYSGNLDIEDHEFELFAERLIIRTTEIAFVLYGADQYGDFRVEGNAVENRNGTWLSNYVTVNYLNYNDKGRSEAKIQFDEIQRTPKNLRCKVVGKWIEAGEIWNFTGQLSKYNALL